MSKHELDRRSFLAIAGAGAAAGLGHEEQILRNHLDRLAAAEKKDGPGPTAQAAQEAKGSLPTGKIKDVTLSRVICGGNLIGGWAHSRDLIYVSKLFKAYNTDEKIMETLQICEEHGVNAVLTNPVSGPVINRYWKERGGKIQWISETHPKPGDVKSGVTSAVENGASMVYIQGNVGDRLVMANRLDVIAETMACIRDCGVPAGVGGHALRTVVECEKAGIDLDFYVKTLHSGDYWSSRRPDQTTEVVNDNRDNFWCYEPEKTIEFMKTVKKPWIAFKVLAAGAIPPRDGFKYAFDNGADFICVGMFDFQVAEDAVIARDTLGSVNRQRPWLA